MQREYGSIETLKIECINRRLGKWRIRYDYVEETDEEGCIKGISFLETELFRKPTMEDVKDFALGIENAKTDQKILSGFVWNGMSVWLSSENQFNYKAAYDLAVQSEGKSLPVIFKFGTTDNPIYHTFETLEDITDFYSSAITYINNTLADGWKKKDSLDWSEYETLLNEN